MQLNKLIVGVTTGITLLPILATTPVMAKEVKEGNNTFYVVEQGDTLSAIAKEYDVDFQTVHGNNEDKINNADIIHVGQKLLVKGDKFDRGKRVEYTVAQPVAVSTHEDQAVVSQPKANTNTSNNSGTVAQSTPAQPSQPQVNTGGGNNDNWHKVNRRKVESGNNYNTFTGNGYLGAYQFAPSTWQAGCNAIGSDPNDFSPANQDAVADWYANTRYFGWQNVPKNGGW